MLPYYVLCGILALTSIIVPGRAIAVSTLGCGAPGMKVAQCSDGSILIYRDEDSTVAVGLMGGYLTRKIEFIYGNSSDFPGSETQQLFPLDENSAFACEGGQWDFMVHPSSSNPHKWDYEPREIKVYSLINGQLSIAHSFKDTNARYGLKSGQIFLGRIDNVVFYWVNYDPRAAFWRKADEADGHRIRLPSKVVDIYGVTKGVHRSYGLVIFRKSSGRSSYAPYEHTFWEFDLKAKKDRAP